MYVGSRNARGGGQIRRRRNVRDEPYPSAETSVIEESLELHEEEEEEKAEDVESARIAALDALEEGTKNLKEFMAVAAQIGEVRPELLRDISSSVTNVADGVKDVKEKQWHHLYDLLTLAMQQVEERASCNIRERTLEILVAQYQFMSVVEAAHDSSVRALAKMEDILKEDGKQQ